MRNLLLTLLLFAATPLVAQDRIVTKDGEVIECKITDYESDTKKVYFLAPGEETDQNFIFRSAVEYIEIDGVKKTYNNVSGFSKVSTRHPADGHNLRNVYGIFAGTGGKHLTTSVSYTHFFSKSHGLNFQVGWNSQLNLHKKLSTFSV